MAGNEPRNKYFEWGGNSFPGYWEDICPDDEILDVVPPAERQAACHDCPKIRTGEYKLESRCCTYFPHMMNFGVGMALHDTSASQRVQKLIDTGFALPTGFYPTPSRYIAAVANSVEGGGFGKDETLACPLLIPDVGCSVHAYRNSVCSSFYCEYDHDETGYRFWDRVQGFVGRVELALAQWAMKQVGWPAEEFFTRLDDVAPAIGTCENRSGDPTSGWSPEVRRELWGPWFGKEEAFFKACADQVNAKREQENGLWEIARSQPIVEARIYEQALRETIPEAIRHLAPEISEEGVEPPPLDDAWYLVKRAGRDLWALPFGGRLGIAANIEVLPMGANDLTIAGASHVAKIAIDGKLERRVDSRERDWLKAFSSPRQLDESVFDELAGDCADTTQELKQFLSECLRSGFLTEG